MQAAITETNALVNIPQNAEEICGMHVIYAAQIWKEKGSKDKK